MSDCPSDTNQPLSSADMTLLFNLIFREAPNFGNLILTAWATENRMENRTTNRMQQNFSVVYMLAVIS
jgi:hypothetical protein